MHYGHRYLPKNSRIVMGPRNKGGRPRKNAPISAPPPAERSSDRPRKNEETPLFPDAQK